MWGALGGSAQCIDAGGKTSCLWKPESCASQSCGLLPKIPLGPLPLKEGRCVVSLGT